MKIQPFKLSDLSRNNKTIKKLTMKTTSLIASTLALSAGVIAIELGPLIVINVNADMGGSEDCQDDGNDYDDGSYVDPGYDNHHDDGSYVDPGYDDHHDDGSYTDGPLPYPSQPGNCDESICHIPDLAECDGHNFDTEYWGHYMDVCDISYLYTCTCTYYGESGCPPSLDEAILLFDVFDADEDCYLSPDEMQVLMDNMGGNE